MVFTHHRIPVEAIRYTALTRDVLLFANGFSYFSVRGLYGGSITRKPLIAPHKTPSVAGDDIVFMSTVRMFQVMQSNRFHW